MNIGVYYHATVTKSTGQFLLPSYFGLFVDALAAEVTTLTLFAHTATTFESILNDYAVSATNIHWVNLGIKKPAWHRTLFGKQLLQKFWHEANACDIFLVRAPTPLAPAFFWAFGKEKPFTYLLVGDYVAGIRHADLPFFRKWAIYLMSLHLDWALKMISKKSCVFSNSTEILNAFQPYALESHLVRTSTLVESDFYSRNDTCQTTPYNILFVGRYDFAKGLRELLEACALLLNKGIPIRLHLAGWEDRENKPVISWLTQKAVELGMEHYFINHGRKSNGNDLNSLYRMADIFVIPSYQEGFPRVIWEAMANSLPVIATTVGDIPHTLVDGQDALLIPKKDVNAIADGIERLIASPSLRMGLIANAMAKAKETTLQTQSKNLAKRIEQFWIKSR